MPIYEYRCLKGHEFEAFQSMSEDPFSKCVECGAACERVLSAPSIHFKGSGFYTTDYARNETKASSAERSKSAAEGSKSEGSKSEGSSAKNEASPKKASDSSSASSDSSKKSSTSD